MKINVSNNPAQEAAAAIAKYIQSNADTTILLLLAGGSALEVLSSLELTDDMKVRTILCMGDERVSENSAENNFLQARKIMLEHELTDIEFINSVPDESESLQQFTERLNHDLKNIFELHKNLKVLLLSGIGADGHTAGIFPAMNERCFSEFYNHDPMYVSVPYEASQSLTERVSITPQWILEHVDRIIGYATGKEKAAVLAKLTTQTMAIHTMPAQILRQHPDSALFTDQNPDTAPARPKRARKSKPKTKRAV